MDDPSARDKPSWTVPFRFLMEILAGALLFTAVAIVAGLLNLLVDWFRLIRVDFPLVWGLTLAEYLLFICDLALFLRFLWVTLQKTWKAMS